MRIWFFIMALVLCMPEAIAMRGRPRGWGEFMAGWNTPAGYIGLAGGVRMSQWLQPTAACGLGGQEGINLSIGNDFTQALNRKVLFRAWGYWTMGMGRREQVATDHHYTTDRSQLLKVGISFAIPVGRLDLDLGGGYSWFLQRGAVTASVPDGVSDLSSEYANNLQDGMVVRVGIGLNMRKRRCAN